ncbi:enoyl-ACP reductase [Paenibacillus alvei]|uniref:enoyl-ACP reductase FabI n=1 Tax=Paenibacillus alvei TaxID=44250 RepID=UPI00038665A5|nr:enoyl-(acyl carrier protein) reductase [Paenibacillus alvei A6-6i-x]
MLLKDKIIVVTGLTNEKSISWGVTKSLHQQGARFVFTYRKEKSLRKIIKLAQSHNIEPLCIVKLDVLDEDSISVAFQQIEDNVGTIHGLVHSVAFAHLDELDGEYVNTTREGYMLAHESSSYSLVALAKHARRIMHNGGSIVTQTYIGSTRVIPNYNIMGVAKAALEASVRYLAMDLGKQGIRVNAISSGSIRTSASIAFPNLNEQLSHIEANAPLRRNVNQDEVGDVTMFLLSDLSRGITGDIIYVDSGYHIV